MKAAIHNTLRSRIFWSLALLLLIGCDKTQVAYTGSYDGKPVKVYSREVKGFSTNSITYEVQLGRLPRVKIDALSTDMFGAPYSEDLYKGVPHQFIRNPPATPKNRVEGAPQERPTMLYLDPKRFSPTDYAAYADFFAHMWPSINSEINRDYSYLQDRIIGTVYGKQDDFVQYFYGKEDGRPYYFDIAPSGSILYHPGSGPARSTGVQGSGLAEKVKMPGRIIRIADTSIFSKAKLRAFKDRSGKSMEDYFTVVEGAR